MRVTGMIVALALLGCAGTPEETTRVAPERMAAQGAADCPMHADACPMRGRETGDSAGAMPGAPGGMHGAAGAMHGTAGGMHGAAGRMHGAAGAGMRHGAGRGMQQHEGGGMQDCPMRGSMPQASAPDTSVPEAAHEHDEADDADEAVESDEVDDTAQAAVRGRRLFVGGGNCMSCHGRDARGTRLAPDLTDDRWLHADGSAASVRVVITNGVPRPREHPMAMPPMGGAQLTERDIGDLAAYVVSLRN